MPRRRDNPIALIAAGRLTLAGCRAAPGEAPDERADPAMLDTATPDRAQVGLMTSLPLYWAEGTGVADLAAGRAAVPWQRAAIEARYRIVPLDTLSPNPALSPDEPEVDPLADLDRLAVIQPRGLSPADNVALDAWVRAGGRLLLVLDPALTGKYDCPLGDPRRPVDSALIPPVVKHWGLNIFYPVFENPDALPVESRIGSGGIVPLEAPGTIDFDPQAGTRCTIMRSNAIATCQVGTGRVTLIADAALFEHSELAGEDGATLRAVLAASLR